MGHSPLKPIEADKELFKALDAALSCSGETVEKKGFTDLEFRVTLPANQSLKEE
jgi:hypothetical protein